MYVFVEPVTEEEVESIQQSQKERVEQYERSVLGLKPEDENDERENSKDWESIMAQVTNEVHNDEIDSGGNSCSEPSGGNSQSISTNVEDGQVPQESEKNAEESVNDDRIRTEAKEDASSLSKPDFTQQEAAAGNAQTESNSERIQEPTSTSDPAEARNPKQILAMTLTTRSKVNGKYRVRPVDLTSSDEWQVEYSITEIASQERARSLYEMCKRRRKNVLPQDNPDDQVEDYYRQKLRQYSEKGREWRNKMDEWESQRQKVIFQAGDTVSRGAARSSQGTVDSSDAERVHGVDDYLRWMYRTA